MRNKTVVPAAAFKDLFREVFSWQFICARLRACGCRRRRPPEVSAPELICGLVFHVVAGPGKLAAHVKQLTGKDVTCYALF